MKYKVTAYNGRLNIGTIEVKNGEDLKKLISYAICYQGYGIEVLKNIEVKEVV